MPSGAGLHSAGCGKDPVLLSGSFRILFLFDVAEAIDLKRLSELLGPRCAPVSHFFPRRTPEYVRFEQAPIAEQSETLNLGDKQVSCTVKYYEFAAVAVQFESLFECDWPALLAQGSNWMDDAQAGREAREIARRHLDQVRAAVIRPNKDWLEESYLLVNLRQISEESGQQTTSADLLMKEGEHIVQLLLGESSSLDPDVIGRILESSISYYTSDLVVVAQAAALIYDRAEEAAATEQVLEYAKTQLLEFRYYDGLMTQLVSRVYDILEAKKNILLQRWNMPRQAERINRIRLDVMELTERMDNAIKFIGDAYYARLYRIAGKRIGLPDYRQLVDEKLKTVGELYDYMLDQFNEARSFVLEVAVAIIAVVELFEIFRGR